VALHGAIGRSTTEQPLRPLPLPHPGLALRHPGLAKACKVWLTAAHQSRVPEAGRAQPKVRARSIEMTFNRTLFAGVGNRRNSKPASVQYSG
jgi:hypothetical protein